MAVHDSSPDPELLRAFRRRWLAGIEADLRREQAEAEAERTRVLPLVREIIADARRRASCRRAWLFGSFAWSQPEPRSDVDLLVEGCPDPDALAAQIWTATGRPAHVVPLEEAASSLRERVLRDGVPL